MSNPFDDETDTDPDGASIMRVTGNVIHYRGESLDVGAEVFADPEARLKRIAEWMHEVDERARIARRAREHPGKF